MNAPAASTQRATLRASQRHAATIEADGLAHRIAQSTARSDIECLTRRVCTPDGRWYITDQPAEGYSVEDTDASFIAQAVRYLELTGQLIRRPGHPTHVRFVEVAR